MASALLLAAACSSSDKTATTSSSSKSSSSEQSSKSDSSSSDGSTGSLSSQSVQGGGSGSGTAGCIAASLAYAKAIAGAGAVLAGQGADLQSDIDQLQNYSAPDEIKDDLQTIVNAYVTYANAIKDSGYSPGQGVPTAAQIQALQDASDQLNTDEIQQAGDRVDQYFQSNCPN
jgi:hypothetical protein